MRVEPSVVFWPWKLSRYDEMRARWHVPHSSITARRQVSVSPRWMRCAVWQSEHTAAAEPLGPSGCACTLFAYNGAMPSWHFVQVPAIFARWTLLSVLDGRWMLWVPCQVLQRGATAKPLLSAARPCTLSS